MEVLAARCYFHGDAAAGINSSSGGAREMKQRSFGGVRGLRVQRVILACSGQLSGKIDPGSTC